MSTYLNNNGVVFPNGSFQYTQGRDGAGASFITSSQYFTPPTSYIKVTIIGGGGAGGSATTNNFAGTPGASGGVAIIWLSLSDNTSIYVTVGGGGSATSTNGGAGGTSSFGSYASATGGGGGTYQGGYTTIGLGGAGSGGDFNLTGQNGIWGFGLKALPNLYGTQRAYSVGGLCPINFGGRPGNSQNSNNSATGIGHGGSGSTLATGSLVYGGNGAPGAVLIEW